MSAAKLSRGKSCVLCSQRKVRCDLNKPCSNCARAGVECHVAPLRPPRRRKRKVDQRALLDRMRRAESLLLQHGLQVSDDVEDQAGDDEDDEDDLENSLDVPRPTDSTSPPRRDTSADSPSHIDRLRHGLSLVQGGSPDTEHEQSNLFHSYSTSNILDATHRFPFVGDTSQTVLTDQHPNAVQIFQLWQTYLNNVDPILRLTHAPTLQKQIIAASADIRRVSRPLETLMFNMYFIAITSLPADEVQETFGVSKSAMLARFHAPAQRSLINANFMGSSDLMVLQAHVLYLICIREFTDPGPHYCLIGIAVRTAQRLGIHRDGTNFNLAPFETEQRRRLWWNLLALDKRIAELSGSTISAGSTPGADCKRPLNINDSDLHVSAKQPPPPSESLTEMVFVMARFELTNAADSGGVRVQTTKDRCKSAAVQTASTQPPRVLAHMGDYAQRIENTFLKSCDPNIPLQLFAQLTIRQRICKFHIQLNVHRLATKSSTIPTEDRLWLLTEAVKMVEADNVLQASPGCRGFLWYAQLQSPFPAHMIFAHELRKASSSPEICERAWRAISENYRLRGLMRALQPPIHVGLTKSLIDAWNAWEHASTVSVSSTPGRNGNKEAPRTPDLIIHLRFLLAAHNRESKPTTDVNKPTTDVNPSHILSHENNTTSAVDTDINMTSSTSIPPPPPQPMANMPTDPDTIDWTASPAQMPSAFLSGDPFDVIAGTELDWAAFFPQQFQADFDHGFL